MAHSTLLALPGMRVGRAGIEQNQDEKLRGTAGSVEMEVNAVGRVISELNREEGVPGEEISLTIDRGLQQRVLNHIGDQTASAVVLDCHNGEVLAMVSTPRSIHPCLIAVSATRSGLNGPTTSTPHLLTRLWRVFTHRAPPSNPL